MSSPSQSLPFHSADPRGARPSPHAPPGHRWGEHAASVLPPLKDDESRRPEREPVPKQHPDAE